MVSLNKNSKLYKMRLLLVLNQIKKECEKYDASSYLMFHLWYDFGLH